jgi:hypothetical protein
LLCHCYLLYLGNYRHTMLNSATHSLAIRISRILGFENP